MSAEVHCKGCGEPMTEGRAYELGNHRWHVKCFRCSNCHDQLTAHTNMLVLGDGTLVCANCSYTCAVCSKKIMDMAVLTNDQAFCASCFVCRNCKKRIDDLQYARTSQGIFCMTCHSALLARKRQRQLQRQQQQDGSRKEPASDKPPRRPTTQRLASGENVTTLRSPTNSESSKSSITSSRSYNRNKDLPDLPPETVHGSIVTPTDSDSSKFSSNQDLGSSTGDLGSTTRESSRQLRVPRKQLAPSAFQNFENDDSSNTSLSAIQRMVSAQSDKDADSSVGDLRTNGSTLTEASSVGGGNGGGVGGLVNGPGNSSFDSNATAKEDTSQSVERKPVPQSNAPESLETSQPPSTPRAQSETKEELTSNHMGLFSDSVNRLPEPLSLGTPPRSTLKDEFPTPDTSRNGDSTQYLSPDPVLNIPQRSQRRPVSPAKSWRSSATNSEYSPRGVRSPAAFTTTPMEHGTTNSPTQAAAPQQAPRSPFSRWWHKRDGSTVSTGSTGSASMPPPVPHQVHKRSASENNTVDPESHQLQNDGLVEALALLAVERDRANAAEAKLQTFQRRDELERELAELEKQVTKMREEHKLLVSRNKQLYDMNAELQRQTLEKFGPNTLWGSQNPSPLSSQESSTASQVPPPAHAARDASKENPLVTRLDDPQSAAGPSSSNGGGSGALQAQFLPFKTAKQWLFRRPNRLDKERGQPGLGGPAYNQYGANGGSSAMYGANNDSNPIFNQKGYPDSGVNGNGVTVLNGMNATNTGGAYGSGRPLQETTRAPASDSLLGDKLSYRTQVDHAPVPYFVTRCFAEVERRGLDTEGVYRKPGSKSQVDAILEQFGPAGDADVGEKLLGGEIQAITSAVKQYLRRLADPVITYDCYEGFIAAGNSQDLNVLRRCIRALPAEHAATLKTVAFHLALVASHESTNLMNTRNLAMVFAPTIARDESGDREIPDMQARNEATHMIIVNAESIFEPVDELL